MGYPLNWQPRGTSDRNITQSCGGGHTAQAHAVSSIPTDTTDSSPIAELNMTQYGQLLPFLMVRNLTTRFILLVRLLTLVSLPLNGLWTVEPLTT